MINKNYPPTREIKANYQITKQDLAYRIIWSEFFEWRFLWNWKAAYRKYRSIKLDIELSKSAFAGIEEEMDEAFKELMYEELDRITKQHLSGENT